MRTQWTKKEIETPVLLAHAIEDSTDIFGISDWGGLTCNPNLVRLCMALVSETIPDLQKAVDLLSIWAQTN